MRNNAAVKLFILFVLVGFSMIPLGLIWSVVSERARYRERVAGEVAASTARAQLFFGPILVIETPVRRVVTNGSVRDSILRRHEELILPESLVVATSVKVETRRRGIYEVPVYRAANRLSARFEIPASVELEPGDRPAGPASARVVFGVSDSRGLRVTPVVRRDGAPLPVRPETGLPWVGQGFSSPIEMPHGPAITTIDGDIELVGTERFGMVPLGGNTDVTMDSNWPHPGFTGGFGPDEREISSQGFRARWRLSRFATGVPAAIAARTNTDLLDKQGNDFTVRFVQPVDVYQQSERAVKYGLLFVVLTFIAFFLFETLKGLAIHPIQYALVAGALAIFFLLLISLSEHLPFATAYVAGSAACVALLVFYAGHVLGSTTRALGFGALLVALYVLLYVILLSEDYALLLGTLLLFAALAVVMVVTRRVDWYRINEGASPKL